MAKTARTRQEPATARTKRTRALRALAKKRSDAAKRGWITRRRVLPRRLEDRSGNRAWIERQVKLNKLKRKRKRQPREDEAPIEYAVNVSYRESANPASAISLQFSVIGPPRLTKDQVIDAIVYTIENEGQDAPKGFKVKIVSWKGGRVPREVPWSSLAIITGEPATRFSIQ